MIKNYRLIAAITGVVIAISAIAGLLGYLYASNTIDEFNTRVLEYKKPIYKLKAGKTAKNVIDDFTDNFFEYQVLRIYLHSHPELTAIQKGEYLIDGKKSLKDLLTDMVAGNVVQKEYPVFAIIEGTNIAKIINKIKARNVHDRTYADLAKNPKALIKKSLEKATELYELIGDEVNSLEGLLSPATYPMYDKEPVTNMLSASMVRQLTYLKNEWENRKKSDLIKTPYEALILASLIEKETLIDEERTLISSAFYNRLKIGMRLQTDPSVMYGVSKTFKGKLTKSHLKKDTPYNTYTRAGLPPTPICMPRESSIYAALHPENSSYLYFVAKTESPKDGHAFTSSLDEHNKAVAAYRKRIKDYKSGKLDTQEEDCPKEESRENENQSFAEENVKDKK